MTGSRLAWKSSNAANSTIWRWNALAERNTIARETLLDRAKDPAKGYTPVLLERMEAIMPAGLAARHQDRHQHGSRQPDGRRAASWPQACGGLGLSAVHLCRGDRRCSSHLLDVMRGHPELPLMEDGAPLESLLPRHGVCQRLSRRRRGWRAASPPAPMWSSPAAWPIPRCSSHRCCMRSAGRMTTMRNSPTARIAGHLHVECSGQLYRRLLR